jgi:SAM-dependent methyltransferase
LTTPAVLLIALCLGLGTGPGVLEAQDDAPAPARSKAPRRRSSPRTYMGRPIADVMTFHGADWLVRPEREQEEQPDAMLDALKIAAGATVADVGAGVGYTSLKLARRVGPTGTVYATDVQPEMLRMLGENSRAAGIKNVKPIRCTSTDPKLPEGRLDLVLMVDVYHECSEPEATLQGLRKALKPGGRLVLVEFRAEDPEVPIKPEHKMTLAQVRRELEPQGFTFKESLEFLPWQHIIIFEKPATPPPTGDGKP